MATTREWNIIRLEKTDSTSSYITRNFEKLPGFSAISAAEQTSGRGQGDHKWHSAPGDNLTFSILIKYDGAHPIAALQQQILTMASSLSVVDFLKNGFGIEASIKKPNDIYVGGNKICGMLIENGLMGGMMQWSIVGMGININQTTFPTDIPNPISTALLTGRQYDTKKCLEDFLRHFNVRFDAIWTEPEALEKDYSSRIISLTK